MAVIGLLGDTEREQQKVCGGVYSKAGTIEKEKRREESPV
jgi:hypothetical protein